MLAIKTVKILNTLAYPICLHRSPSKHARECLVNLLTGHPELSKQDAQAALDEAIRTTGWACELAVLGRHTEDDMRNFFVTVRNSLDVVC